MSWQTYEETLRKHTDSNPQGWHLDPIIDQINDDFRECVNELLERSSTPRHPKLEVTSRPLKHSIEGKVLDAMFNDADTAEVGIDRHTGALLHHLVSTNKLKRTLEIGLAHGFSAIYLCAALKEIDGRHTAIDPAQYGPPKRGLQGDSFNGSGMHNLKCCGHAERVNLIAEPSHAALPSLHAAGHVFDLVFVDGMHVFDYVLVDSFYADLVLTTNGYLVLDDAWMPAVQRVALYFLTNRGYQWVETGDSRLVVLKKLSSDTRTWDFHRAF